MSTKRDASYEAEFALPKGQGSDSQSNRLRKRGYRRVFSLTAQAPEQDLFSCLFRWAHRQGENFTTEGFVWLLNLLLEKAPTVGREFVSYLCFGRPKPEVLEAQRVQVATQEVTAEGKPDICIETPRLLAFVEVKTGSGALPPPGESLEKRHITGWPGAEPKPVMAGAGQITVGPPAKSRPGQKQRPWLLHGGRPQHEQGQPDSTVASQLPKLGVGARQRRVKLARLRRVRISSAVVAPYGGRRRAHRPLHCLCTTGLASSWLSLPTPKSCDSFHSAVLPPVLPALVSRCQRRTAVCGKSGRNSG